jgi:hypothetical protein
MATLKQYRHALASGRGLGGFIPFVATSTSASSTSTQEIISTRFMDDTPNVSSRFEGTWVYGALGGGSTALAGEQRQLRHMPLDAATGTLYVTRPFGSIPQSGHNWEMYFNIPAIREDSEGRDGYREIINEALREMVIPGRIDISGVSQQTHYTLDTTTYPWIREPGRIVNVWRAKANANDLDYIDAQDWKLIPDFEDLVLQVPAAYATGETFHLEVLAPANSRLNLTGTWAYQGSPDAGLVDDADEAVPSIPDVVTVARELVYAEMGRNGPEAETKYWSAKEIIAGRTANVLKFETMSKARRDRPSRYVGDAVEAL